MVDENFKTLHLFGLVEKEGETVQGKQTHLCNHVAHRLDINLGLRENFGRFVSQGLDSDDLVLVVVLSTPVDLTLVVVVVPTFTYDPFGAALEAVDERYRITPSALVILQKASFHQSIRPNSNSSHFTWQSLSQDLASFVNPKPLIYRVLAAHTG